MKFGQDICGPSRLNPTDFGDCLNFPLSPLRVLTCCKISKNLLSGLALDFTLVVLSELP